MLIMFKKYVRMYVCLQRNKISVYTSIVLQLPKAQNLDNVPIFLQKQYNTSSRMTCSMALLHFLYCARI